MLGIERLFKPVPVGTVEVRTKLAHAPEKLREYVSDMANFDEYAPGLSDTKIDPTSGTDGHYATTMRYMGTVAKADLNYHKTEKGVDFKGHWDVQNIRFFPPIEESVSIEVNPTDDGGSILSCKENYHLPLILMPAFPLFRYSLSKLIKYEHKTIGWLLADKQES